MIIFGLFWFSTIACCTYAWLAGGTVGRWGAGLFLVASFASPFATHHRHGWDHANASLMAIDTLHFLGLYILAVRSTRFWPIWSAGLQLLAVLTTVAEALGPSTRERLYHGLETFWSIPMLATMCIGIALDRRAKIV